MLEEIKDDKKHHCCKCCNKYKEQDKHCDHHDKHIKECSLDCEPKAEWEKGDKKC